MKNEIHQKKINKKNYSLIFMLKYLYSLHRVGLFWSFDLLFYSTFDESIDRKRIGQLHSWQWTQLI